MTLIWGFSSIQSLSSAPSFVSSQLSSVVTQPVIATEASNKEVVLAGKIAKVFTSTCPIAEPGDNKAQELCAQKLSKNELLRDSMSKEVRWGGQKELGHFNLKDSKTTTFNPLVW
jgi:hypothetical protein